ncbi:MAG: hypothetical protein FWF76_05500 [Oscillospiraceae bacterium]|nr:hypothetical protein [Oscillospiraceae bacterium]
MWTNEHLNKIKHREWEFMRFQVAVLHEDYAIFNVAVTYVLTFNKALTSFFEIFVDNLIQICYTEHN